MIESNVLVYARMRAALSGVDAGLVCVWGQARRASNRLVPKPVCGPLLPDGALRRLARMLAKKTPPNAAGKS